MRIYVRRESAAWQMDPRTGSNDLQIRFRFIAADDAAERVHLNLEQVTKTVEMSLRRVIVRAIQEQVKGSVLFDDLGMDSAPKLGVSR